MAQSRFRVFLDTLGENAGARRLVAIGGIVSGMVLQKVFGPYRPVTDQRPIVLHLPLDNVRKTGTNMNRLEAAVTGVLDLHSVVNALEDAACDTRVVGVVGTFGNKPADLSRSDIHELRDAVKKFKSSGKFTHFHTEKPGSLPLYYLASAFNKITVAPEVSLKTGLVHNSFFFRRFLERWGLEFLQFGKGKYKSGMSFLTSDKMNSEDKEQMGRLYSSIYQEFVEGIAEERKIPSNVLRRVFEKGPFSSQELVELGLVDEITRDSRPIMMEEARNGMKDLVYKLTGSVPEETKQGAEKKEGEKEKEKEGEKGKEKKEKEKEEALKEDKTQEKDKKKEKDEIDIFSLEKDTDIAKLKSGLEKPSILMLFNPLQINFKKPSFLYVPIGAFFPMSKSDGQRALFKVKNRAAPVEVNKRMILEPSQMDTTLQHLYSAIHEKGENGVEQTEGKTAGEQKKEGGVEEKKEEAKKSSTSPAAALATVSSAISSVISKPQLDLEITELNEPIEKKLALLAALKSPSTATHPVELNKVAPLKVLVIHAKGSIHDGPNHEPTSIGSDTLCSYLRAAQRAPYSAVVLHLNTGGGSATASDKIWAEVVRTRLSGKPVVVCMGDAAASGGYYIAAAADRIVAQPTTITGSIGVFSARPLISKFLEEQGITTDSVGAFGSPIEEGAIHRTPTRDERKLIDQSLEEIYKQFTGVVAKGRNLDPSYVHRISQGRVWTGRDARALGLVDHLGGVDEGVRVALGLLGVSSLHKVHVDQVPSVHVNEVEGATVGANVFSLKIRELFSQAKHTWEAAKLFSSYLKQGTAVSEGNARSGVLENSLASAHIGKGIN